MLFRSDPSPCRQLGFLHGAVDDAFFVPLPVGGELLRLLLGTLHQLRQTRLGLMDWPALLAILRGCAFFSQVAYGLDPFPYSRGYQLC